MEREIERATDALCRDAGYPALVADALAQAAARYFEECEDDFCVQDAGGEVLVFGGTNRLLWTPARGFYPDRSYCTENFLQHYAAIGRVPDGRGVA